MTIASDQRAEGAQPGNPDAIPSKRSSHREYGAGWPIRRIGPLPGSLKSVNGFMYQPCNGESCPGQQPAKKES